MVLSVTHSTVAAGTDAGNGEIAKAQWNAAHSISGTLSADNTEDGTTNKVFTAVEKTKLAGIEAAADVTDATNVAAALPGIATAVFGGTVQSGALILRDLGSDHLRTIYVLSDNDASYDASWTYPNGNISVTWPSGSYTLNTAPTFSSVSPSGTATVTLSSLTRDSVYIGMVGLSHGDGTSRQLELHYSTNNGGAWALWGNLLAAAVASTVTVYGGLTIHGLVSGNAVVLLPVTATSAAATLAATARTGSVSAGAQINALKLQWATGVNFDAGSATIKLFD